MKDIYALSPVDKTAALVTSETNHATATWQIDQRVRSKERLPVMAFVGPRKHDLSGKVYGSLTVIGLFIKQNPKKNAQWVVLCKCGYYETKKRKALEAPFSNDSLCCGDCQYINKIVYEEKTYKHERI